jgi:hypothetical protein
MNSLLRHLLFVSVHLDEILIFSKTRNEHADHLRQVLSTLEKHKLHAKSTKCSFFKDNVEFLGHVLDCNGVRPTDSKLKAVRYWPIPTNLKTFKRFLVWSTTIDDSFRILLGLLNH